MLVYVKYFPINCENQEMRSRTFNVVVLYHQPCLNVRTSSILTLRRLSDTKYYENI